MENTLEVYTRTYDANRSVCCMDETNEQLIGEIRSKLPVAPGQPVRWEHEYVRNGVTQTFLEVEPLAGRRHVGPSPRRTRQDWARTIAERLEIHYTPKHGSWLRIAEIELSVLCGRCLNRRISDQEAMRAEIDAWLHDRNTRHSTVDWQPTTVDARIKLKHLYPKLNSMAGTRAT